MAGPYYSAMDREAYRINDIPPARSLEKPIVPLYRIGTTVPETDPSGRFKNVVQAVQAAIRGGAGSIQIVLTQSRNSPLGGAPKAMGPEVREALRELQLANQVDIIGVELPTGSISNLSGWDPQQGVLDERTRERELNEVRDAIKFTADVAQGGGVDMWSQEFPRTMFDAEWNEGNIFRIPEEKEKADIWFVDTRTGAVQRLPREGIPVSTEVAPGEFKAEVKKFEDFRQMALEQNPNLADNPRKLKEVTFYLFRDKVFEHQEKLAAQQAVWHERQIESLREGMEAINQRMQIAPEAEKEKMREVITRYKRHLEHEKEAQSVQEAIRARHEETRKHLKPMEQVAKEKSIQSYAEAGIMAMEETSSNPNAREPIYVGPELGWPNGWGGHPDEFIELVTESRKQMAKKLQDQGYSQAEASRKAQMHIKGLFDTGHLGMWLEQFRPDLPWDKRVEEFSKWYKEQVDKLVKSNTVGSIQAVDSMSGAHAHLPPGQGILPVKEAVEAFVKKGWAGKIVSEGHEEEKFGEGRIMTKTWEMFNPALRFGRGPEGIMAHKGYFTQPYSPRQMFGSYTPPFGEYKPWSEIPFE